MRRRYCTTPVVCILTILVLTVCISAVPSQGLAWGYLEGEIYYFSKVNHKVEAGVPSTIEFHYVLYAPAFPAIEDPITNVSAIPQVIFQERLLNGTLVDSQSGPVQLVAVPIGNWSLLTEMYRNLFEHENTTLGIINTPQEWGYVDPILDSETLSTTATLIYSKSDGVLNRFEQVYEYGDQDRYLSITIERTNAPLENPILLPALLLLTTGIVAVVLIIIARKKSGRDT